MGLRKSEIVLLIVAIIAVGSLFVYFAGKEKERNIIKSAMNTLMEEQFNAIYPDQTISFLGSQSPDYQNTLDRQSELRKVFMSGDERFLERKLTPYELSDAAARGRFARFKAMCRIKPQQGCPY
ncbi:hypothetical protein A3I28_00330 [Candidatus Giovannonibacteria bacterium RIFCSPLOWO2_02_FULL_43_37]|nr:MAG: hypothetical protein A3C76_03310 [Candidatus Giovannonibacteria bacterium RIFCSPHIGHO2_02_FULL_44_51]OGF71338.1 MAG: hypothetical protein A3E35_00065 [Candidatus Giovannonibacteria bacterium RIFCSPHIGHO2_12_FULL_44_22]OGF86101.1 MAG: hypothetical protein A3I28_00330 [Candidatus Giovannonibacteria bacterium RIFCSPLOWO2_02_FULL_43_37]